MKHPPRQERRECQRSFIEEFVKNVDAWVEEIDAGGRFRPAYTLITGAGASRSAGIPLQGEMESAIKQCLGRYYPNLEHDPPSRQEWEDAERLLFMACLCRANREPNLTHLIAADLASIGIFGPLLTTNFDDLLLAGFWGLANRTSYVEPHVIYDVRGSVRRRLGLRKGVPLVIKAHGHHTAYWMARREKQVRRLIPEVLRLYGQCPRPVFGFVVVGYSGGWDDGVMAILRRKDLTRGLPVYWLVRDRPAEPGTLLRKVMDQSDVRFITIQDSDEFFVRLWERLCEENPWLAHRLLSTTDLFSAIPMSERAAYIKVATSQPKWSHGIQYKEGLEDEDFWKLPEMKLLQDKYLPILREIESADTRNLEHALTRSARYLQNLFSRSLVPQPEEHDYSLAEVDVSERLDLLPSGLEWTRRNRALFRIALGGTIGRFTSIEILGTLESLSAQAARIER